MDAPNDYKTAGIFMIIAGALNIIGGLVGGIVFFCSVYLMCCSIFGLAPLIVGIFEVIHGIKATKGEPSPSIKTISILGLVAGCLFLNIVVIVMEILTLVWLSKPEVAEFLEA